jgi:hypothetical protein
MTYGTNDSALSARDRSVIDALVTKLDAGASVTITGFAYHDATLARKRATIVANLLKSAKHVHVTIAINTTSRVGKVLVTTTHQ